MTIMSLISRYFVLLAIRRPRDLLVKPLLFLIIIHAAANLAEILLLRDAAWKLSERTLLTTVTALPFMALVFTVVTHLDRVQQQLAQLAATDMLTGLHNRRAFMEKSNLAQLRGGSGVVLVIDADHFKKVNDLYGHAVGDACLQAIAAHLRATLRAGDVVGRLGGEEFGVFLPATTLPTATLIGQRLAKGISTATADTAISVTLSVGAAITGTDRPLEQALKYADDALYRAKNTGRAQLVSYDAPEHLRDHMAAA